MASIAANGRKSLGVAAGTAIVVGNMIGSGFYLSPRLAGDGAVRRVTPVEGVAFLFSVFTLYGCAATAVLYGLMLLVCGIPVYVWQQRRALMQVG